MLKTLVSENEANKGRETRGEGSRKRHRAAARTKPDFIDAVERRGNK